MIVELTDAGTAGTESTMNPLLNDTDRVRLFREQGYFVARFLVGPAERAELRAACDLALEVARAGSNVEGHQSPSINLLRSESLFAPDPSALERLLAFIASPRSCALLEGLARPGEPTSPRVKKLDYYHEQTLGDWDGDWHRDSQFVESFPERENALIGATTWVHVRVAFEPDDRLEIVPGSQLRWDTDEELRVRKGARRREASMPEAVRIELGRGDAC